ncbi:MAG: helix-turn-helix transcriptional regulator [Bacteroidota bacterium]
MLTVRKIQPKVLLPYIEAFKIYHFEDTTDVQLLPKGVFEMVFQSEHCFQHNTNYSLGWKLRPRNFVGGLHNQSYTVNSGQNGNYCIVVEFKPNTAKYFIPEKLNLFQNAVVDIHELWGNDATTLTNKIDLEKKDELKINLIENFLLQQFSNSYISIIDKALNEIFNSKGFTRIEELSKKAWLSKAQFRKRFNEEIGISPIRYSKIVRVNTAVEMMKTNAYSMTDISYSMGYFDQAHFIKDFKSVVGVSPNQYQNQMI